MAEGPPEEANGIGHSRKKKTTVTMKAGKEEVEGRGGGGST